LTIVLAGLILEITGHTRKIRERGKFEMKRLFVATVSILLALTVVLSLGAECSASFTTAKISEATMALSVDDYAKPVNPTNKFYVDTPAIYCSCKVSNAPESTDITSVWIYVRGEVDLENYEIDSYGMTVEGTTYLYFYMNRPTNGWPIGEYKLVLYLDGKEQTSLSFTVQAK
jgi:hypothetical protein